MKRSDVFHIPLPGVVVTLAGRFPLEPATWDQFMVCLEAMRPGLVAEEPEREGPPSGEWRPDGLDQ